MKPQGRHEQRLLTTEEFAAQIGSTSVAERIRRSRGGGPPFVRIGRLVRYRQDDIDAWIAGMRPITTRPRVGRPRKSANT